MDTRLEAVATVAPHGPRPGERWVSKGRAGHGGDDVHVRGYTKGRQVVFEAGHDAGQRKRSRRHTVPLDASFTARKTRSNEPARRDAVPQREQFAPTS